MMDREEEPTPSSGLKPLGHDKRDLEGKQAERTWEIVDRNAQLFGLHEFVTPKKIFTRRQCMSYRWAIIMAKKKGRTR